MVYALKLYFAVFVIGALVILGGGCVSVEKPEQITSVPVTRTQPSNWHKNNHRDYFDVYGLVKSVIISPLDSDAVKTDESKELQFNANGYLTQQKITQPSAELVIKYHYHTDFRLDFIESDLDDEPYRRTVFQYDNKQTLTNIRFEDKRTNKRFNKKQNQQLVSDGWIEMAVAVEAIESVEYRQFNAEGLLRWTSKGGINNGAGQRFYIKTSDHITSANVINRGTDQMQGVGGYGFVYDETGRLWQVTSFNAHNQEVYHTTRYTYNEQGLLWQENRVVSGQSLFNDTRNETVRYIYHHTDLHGNWLRRTVSVTGPGVDISYEEKRLISYYE